jgi:hypothetical protein
MGNEKSIQNFNRRKENLGTGEKGRECVDWFFWLRIESSGGLL